MGSANYRTRIRSASNKYVSVFKLNRKKVIWKDCIAAKFASVKGEKEIEENESGGCGEKAKKGRENVEGN